MQPDPGGTALCQPPEGTVVSGHFEIVSLEGVLSRHGSHYHIVISDGDGMTFGTHLVEGCSIFTTAEIVIAELTDI
jgi:uncharacterized protein